MKLWWKVEVTGVVGDTLLSPVEYEGKKGSSSSYGSRHASEIKL